MEESVYPKNAGGGIKGEERIAVSGGDLVTNPVLIANEVPDVGIKGGEGANNGAERFGIGFLEGAGSFRSKGWRNVRVVQQPFLDECDPGIIDNVGGEWRHLRIAVEAPGADDIPRFDAGEEGGSIGLSGDCDVVVWVVIGLADKVAVEDARLVERCLHAGVP